VGNNFLMVGSIYCILKQYISGGALPKMLPLRMPKHYLKHLHYSEGSGLL